MSAWVRRCLTVASLLAVWLVVRPAVAAAPVCDERGASMLAPMPILDVPDQSVDVGDHTDGCEFWVTPDTAYEQGNPPSPTAPSMHLDATLPVLVLDVPPAFYVQSPIGEVERGARAGTISLLERPPRQEA